MAERGKDKPILFSGPMIRALLDGRKVQTRRILKPQPVTGGAQTPHHFVQSACRHHWLAQIRVADTLRGVETFITGESIKVPYHVGQLLWVREAFLVNGWAADVATIFYMANKDNSYTEMCEQFPRAGRRFIKPTPGKWRPSIHMPRWISRLTLKVESVKVERVQDISEEDAIAEGIERNPVQDGTWLDYPAGSSAAGWRYPVASFRSLWNSINGPGAWSKNPWVIALGFKVIKQNIDQIAERQAA